MGARFEEAALYAEADEEDQTHGLFDEEDAQRQPKSGRLLAFLGAAVVLAVVAVALLPGTPARPAETGTGDGFIQEAESLPCNIAGDNCNASKCCTEPGMTCFEKNPFWASCNKTCTPGLNPLDPNPMPWTCKKLSEPAAAGGDAAGAAAGAGGSCAWEGEDCLPSKCCRRAGFSCFSKSKYFAGCKKACAKGEVDKVDPDGLPWDCAKLGGSQPPKVVLKAAPGAEAGTSLFCFMVESPYPPEQALVAYIKSKQLSIYKCDASGIFNGGAAEMSAWKSVANTEIFVKVWQQVKTDGKFASHDWTVKVDPDAVFFADRLKVHLKSLSAPADTALYVKNVDFKFGFMGALEVLSTKAVDAYVAHSQVCSDHLGHDGGEDFYTKSCLDAIGVGYMTDLSLLDDKYAHLEEKLIIEDIHRCKANAPVAFHCYKNPKIWQGCYDVAMGILSLPDVVLCAQRTDEQPICRQF